MNRFTSVFERVIDALDRLDIDHLVVGSVAASHWGLIRSTQDIDVVILVDPAEVPGLVPTLESANLYVPHRAATAALAATGSFNVLDPTTAGKVDIFVCAADDEFEAMRLRRRVRAEVFGVPTWVATPEDVILSKLRWRTESASEVQWRDCFELAAINDLDREHLRRWAETLGIASDLEELLASLPE
ncbi:MAG: hypothetical protein ACKOIA_06135 [Acidimicrobiia bacterium]